jgi:transcriptional regulator with XRE-family HTH domain
MQKTIYSVQAKIIQDAIREVRERSGLTQRELCRKLGREHSFVSKCELGERRIDMVEFYWICRACDALPEKEAAKIMRAFAKLDKA